MSRQGVAGVAVRARSSFFKGVRGQPVAAWVSRRRGPGTQPLPARASPEVRSWFVGLKAACGLDMPRAVLEDGQATVSGKPAQAMENPPPEKRRPKGGPPELDRGRGGGESGRAPVNPSHRESPGRLMENGPGGLPKGCPRPGRDGSSGQGPWGDHARPKDGSGRGGIGS